jgi:hypothetical protein
MHAASAGFLYFPRSPISDLAGNVSDPLILVTAEKYASEEVMEAIVMVRGNFSLRDILEWLESWMEISGIPYRHEHMAHSHILVLGLHMGKKISLLVAEILRLLFKRIGVTTSCDINTNSVIFRVDES